MEIEGARASQWRHSQDSRNEGNVMTSNVDAVILNVLRICVIVSITFKKKKSCFHRFIPRLLYLIIYHFETNRQVLFNVKGMYERHENVLQVGELCIIYDQICLPRMFRFHCSNNRIQNVSSSDVSRLHKMFLKDLYTFSNKVQFKTLLERNIFKIHSRIVKKKVWTCASGFDIYRFWIKLRDWQKHLSIANWDVICFLLTFFFASFFFKQQRNKSKGSWKVDYAQFELVFTLFSRDTPFFLPEKP